MNVDCGNNRKVVYLRTFILQKRQSMDTNSNSGGFIDRMKGVSKGVEVT